MRAGTIVASNYLAMAGLLAESFLTHHPDSTFAILLVDDLPIDDRSGSTVPAGASIMRLGDIGIEGRDLDMMRTIYDVMELSTAVKPSLLATLLDDDDIACYLDPDIFVYGPFADLLEPARAEGIVLTPHVLLPIVRDGLSPTERQIMGSGIFNLGFIAVGPSARPFLEWWQERLLIDAVSDVDANLFTDQRWIDWVPALFGASVCRDPGMNIAWWNVHERPLERDGGGVHADGHPIRFVHFSGYSPDRPDVFSKHQVPTPRTPLVGVLRELADEYGRALLARGHAEHRATPYQWAATEDGLVLSTAVRRAIRSALLGGHRTGSEAPGLADDVPLAFGPTAGRLRAWLDEPVAGTDTIRFSRIEAELWSSRPDLRAVFPRRDAEDADRYRHWLDHDLTVLDALPGLLPPRPATAPAAPEPPTVPAPLPRRVLRRLRREAAAVASSIRARR